MAKQLFPVVSIPSLSRPKQNNDIRYKRGPAWDYEAGDFARDGAGKIPVASGRDTYMAWCVKTSQTERFAKLAYPSSIGAELEAAKQEKSREATELALERTIREALMVNPRTEYVRDFAFQWDGDRVRISFRVKGRNIEEFQATV